MAQSPVPTRKGYGDQQADLQAIGFPPGFRLFQLEEYKGLNTKAQRPAIDDQEMAFCENWMPIGTANLRTMFGKAANLYTPGQTIVWHFQYNIAAIDYSIVFLEDGSAVQVRLSNGATTTVGTAGTFWAPGGSLPHAVQWANSGILIVSDVSSNGYWAWDGTTLYSAGTAAPSWLSGLAAPITLTGTTNGTTSITSVSPNPINSGVLINMGITSSTGDIPVGTLITAGTSTTLTISNAATGSNSAETLTVAWDMPSGVQGTAIETFQSRVWILNGVTRSTSAASNGTTFSASNGGVIATSTDNTLRVKYVGLKENNGYLYIFADSSCYYVSNIQTVTTGSSPSTTYQYTPIDEQIGSPWRDTIQPFGRSVLFGNPNGVYSIVGSSATKISDALDGLFLNADFTTPVPTAASATMFNIKVACFLFHSTNVYTGLDYNMIAVFDGKRWWTATQETAPTFISPQETNSTLACYGTDGNVLYKLFDQPSAGLTKTLISKLWGGQYGFLSYKNALRVYTEIDSPAGEIAMVTMTLDNQNGSLNNPIQAGAAANVVFVNSSGQVVQFVNSTAQNIQFSVRSTIAAVNASGSGLLLGFTLTSTNLQIILERSAIGYIDMTALF